MCPSEPPKRIPPSIPPSSARKRPDTRGAKPAHHNDAEAAKRSNSNAAFSGRMSDGGGRDAGGRGRSVPERSAQGGSNASRSTSSRGLAHEARQASSSTNSSATQRAGRNYRSAQTRNQAVAGSAAGSASRPNRADVAGERSRTSSSYNQVRRESIKYRNGQEANASSSRGAQPGGRPNSIPPSYAPRRTAPSFEPRGASNARPARVQLPSPARPVSPSSPQVSASRPPRKRKRSRGKIAGIVAVLVLALLIAWPILLVNWASGKITHVDALSGKPATPGTTYLLAGSDSREGTEILDDTEGQRSDTIMLLHHAENGNSYLISLPRDTWVEIPDYGMGKINASYAYGGPELLTQTVENLSGLTVDHFVQIGMDGVTSVVDAVDGVELCLDYDVNDVRSELVWESGCHVADGHTALAFARMRYADPNGDIGRAERQRQVIGAIVKNVSKPSTTLNPMKQMQVAGAGAEAVSADDDTDALDLARMAWYFRQATSNGNTGTPPIASLALPTNQGVAVQLDEQLTPQFFDRLADGSLTAEELKEYAF